ncbi:hypothetical protein ACFL2M_00350 [Patescibacteria group bacterium]
MPVSTEIKIRSAAKKDGRETRVKKLHTLEDVENILLRKYDVPGDPDQILADTFHNLLLLAATFAERLDELKKREKTINKKSHVCLEMLDGKRVLDLSNGLVDCLGEKASHEHWLCRALAECNAQPVCIDGMELDDEPFEVHQLDLSTPSVLNFLPPRSFDVVCIFVKDSTNREACSAGSLLAQVQNRANRLLKEGGYFINGDRVMQRVDGILA